MTSSPDRRAATWAEDHQVGVYLSAMAAGALLGLGRPGAASVLEPAITPLLAALLYSTFLTLPVTRLRRAAADRRFLATLLGTNFLVLPVLVWLLTRPIADAGPLLVGALLVLLCPCVDWVIAFTRLCAGDVARLLAATPLLMGLQALLLPGYLLLMTGPGALPDAVWAPFAHAFLILIALPLAASALTQRLAAERPVVHRIQCAATDLMVPLLAAVLLVVVACHAESVSTHAGALARLAGVYLAFALLAPVVGAAVGRARGHRAPVRRALAVSATARNSLVVLPLALAHPHPMVALAVVTQTLVELLAMVVLVALVPRLVR